MEAPSTLPDQTPSDRVHSPPAWAADVMTLLRERDAAVAPNSPYYEAFSALLARTATTRTSDQATGAAELKQRLENAAFEREKLVGELRDAREQIDTLASEKARLQHRRDHLQAEIRDKNRQIEVVNDEQLVAQMQANVLQERHEALVAEHQALREQHEALVARWMARAESEAARMNEAVERTNGSQG
ncbi:autophagy-related protein 16 [Diutina catenulata]